MLSVTPEVAISPGGGDVCKMEHEYMFQYLFYIKQPYLQQSFLNENIMEVENTKVYSRCQWSTYEISKILKIHSVTGIIIISAIFLGWLKANSETGTPEPIGRVLLLESSFLK